ncbi:type II toxin-antitoxin system HicA family toxin [Rhodococcus sp. (in: high G+C Gram-positive bacteria)]|uniref:type II toxin-antitoxin system HicA family toxin n=1 Tax=Rhodococcus sp. TaxID=1831 RepID=UPI001A1B30C8|nr:type II toxin-antitoxin system HicA family toxin [Rhodococcus sp. (in: high G+C Gram-positive bacteria)]
MVNNGGFPSYKATKLKSILKKKLGYRAVPKSGSGSHTKLRSEGRPDLLWAFHNGVTIPPGLVRNILVVQVGLSIEEARKVVGNG